MINKQTFGAFVKEKRLEKKMTQKDLAELLFISESAVSKWEMGKSYPDITLIPDLCRILEVSEKELIEGANDTEYRVIKEQARLYRRISETWFWGLTIAYGIALLICVICDLAVNHGITFSTIVFGSLVVAFSFAPTWIRFTNKHKLAVFVGTTYASLVFLFLICCIRNHEAWAGTASVGVLLGYVFLFGPFLLHRYLPDPMKKFSLLIYFGAGFICLVLLLAVIRMSVAYPLGKALLVASYAYCPLMIIALIHLVAIHPFLKASIDILFSGLIYWGTEWFVRLLFGTGTSQSYHVDFCDWGNYAGGNIQAIVLAVCLLLSVIFAIVGLVKSKKGR